MHIFDVVSNIHVNRSAPLPQARTKFLSVAEKKVFFKKTLCIEI